MEASPALTSELGRITIARDVVAHIVGRTAAECYGVVGMAARPGIAGGVGKLLPGSRATQGVVVGSGDEGLRVDVYVVVEYGLNLAEVGASLRTRVRYELERLTGLAVAGVEVHIQDVRRSG